MLAPSPERGRSRTPVLDKVLEQPRPGERPVGPFDYGGSAQPLAVGLATVRAEQALPPLRSQPDQDLVRDAEYPLRKLQSSTVELAVAQRRANCPGGPGRGGQICRHCRHVAPQVRLHYQRSGRAGKRRHHGGDSAWCGQPATGAADHQAVVREDGPAQPRREQDGAGITVADGPVRDRAQPQPVRRQTVRQRDFNAKCLQGQRAAGSGGRV